jgi:hypothetical protein
VEKRSSGEAGAKAGSLNYVNANTKAKKQKHDIFIYKKILFVSLPVLKQKKKKVLFIFSFQKLCKNFFMYFSPYFVELSKKSY